MKRMAVILSLAMLLSLFGGVQADPVRVEAEGLPGSIDLEDDATEEMAAVESITLSVEKDELFVGESIKVKAKITPADADTALTYTSSDESVAVVDKNGQVKALSAGTVTITATAANGVKDTLVLKIKKAAPKRELQQIYAKENKIFLLLGDPETALVIMGRYRVTDPVTSEVTQEDEVIAEGLAYSVSQAGTYIEIDKNGLVTAKAVGTASILVTYQEKGQDYTAACEIEVMNPIEALEFAEPSVDLVNGESMTIKALYRYHDGTKQTAVDVTYTSSDAKTVKVAKTTGKITALKATATPVTITAATNDGRYTASYCVNVPEVPITEIKLNASSVKDLTIGDEFQLEATVKPANATNKKLTYTVEGVVPLNENVSDTVISVGKTSGLVKIKGLGEATVVAKSADGLVEAECTFKVYQNYFDVTKLGANGDDAKGDGTAIKNALKWACAVDEQITVYIPAGTYYIGTRMYIYSNTKLVLDDKAVLVRMSSAASCPMLQSACEKTLLQGKTTSTVKGYGQCENVEITGGVWNGNASGKDYTNNIYIGHARNIYIHDTAIKNNSGAHLLELAGVKDAVVENVALDGYKICTRKGYGLSYQTVKEAIQLDYCSEPSTPAMKPYDFTACDTITIRNCSISNYMCGIGAHGYRSGVYLKNIKIENNTFKNITNCCIDLRNFKNVTVKSNTAAGYHTFLYGYNSTGKIEKNKLTNKSFQPYTKSYRMYSNGIYLSTKSDFKILNNTIQNCGNNGISIASKSKATIKNNKIKNNSQYGIKVVGATATIKGNTVSGNGNSRQYYADADASISSDDIRGYYVKLNAEYKYTGKAIKPSIKVANLKKGKSYTVTYKKNKKLGTAQVIIKGKGTKKGKLVLTFKIVKKLSK
ncbi:MAG: Ig-like domain-containing protein [Lachnospiraceae bacterium]|nr:Ig-like domain-containing protein [Lachnospiraceae bacterium]